ncbi:MAG: 50S ribosomal protein L23 [Patescibacteria group bacterium]
MGILDRVRGKQSTDDAQAPVSSGSADETQKKDATSTVKRAVRKSTKAKKEEATTGAEPVIGAAKAVTLAGNAYASLWLRRPHVSEKAAVLTEKGMYVFDVPLKAEKIAIKKAVESLYKVKVEKVRTLRGPGKVLHRGKRVGVRNDWKKAIVTLKKGQKIELYEGV